MRKDSRNVPLPVALLIIAMCVTGGPALGATVSLGPTKDNTLYEDPNGSLSNGIGWHFFAGPNSGGGIRRGLLAFDIAGNITAGSTIIGVTLTLNMSRTVSADQPVAIHRVLADWGEGTSDAGGGEGGGTFATPGDATWLHTFFNSSFWADPGGDFSPVASATQVVVDSGQYSWSGAGLVADVQSMLDNPAGNFGWMVVGNEPVIASVKRFDSKDNGDPAARPVLVVEYTLPTGIGDGTAPPAFELHPARPNPFNPATTITYTMRERGVATLAIHDGRGRMVRHFDEGAKGAGTHEVVWNGRDDDGLEVPSGVYFVRLESAGRVQSRKVVLLK